MIMTFEKELESLLNKYSVENDSNTPDFILAGYITACLSTWDIYTRARDKWYGTNKDSLPPFPLTVPLKHRKSESVSLLQV